MIKILFVCHGNICRSPMGEYILKDMVKKLGIGDKFISPPPPPTGMRSGVPFIPPPAESWVKWA
jgi:protein-tyrosine phosphatase